MEHQSDSEENPYRVNAADFTSINAAPNQNRYDTWDDGNGEIAQSHNEFTGWNQNRTEEGSNHHPANWEDERTKCEFFTKKVGFEIGTFCNGQHRFPGFQGR